jgi:hypothetical protein
MISVTVDRVFRPSFLMMIARRTEEVVGSKSAGNSAFISVQRRT